MLKRLIPPQQRSYVDAHPLAVWFSLGVAFTGGLNLVAPHVSESSASLVLAPILLLAFNLTWFFGGGLSLVGILRGLRRLEAAGMSLLAGGFASYYCVVATLIPRGWLTGVFIATLAIGCAIRARHITHTGYVTFEVRHRDL